MHSSVFLIIAIGALGSDCRQLLAPNFAPAPLAGAHSVVLNLTNPDVSLWARIFQRYYSLSQSLVQQSGTDKSASYETIFLLANAALSAAAAKNVQAAITSTSIIQNAISYTLAAGNQTVAVATSSEARQYGFMNVTAYTQVAGESAVSSAEAASSGDLLRAAAAADRAVVATQDGLNEARSVSGPASAPLDRPY